MRVKDGEIQIIPYANSMLAETNMGDESTEWKAIKKDGTLVEPGTADTLKWDWVSGKIQLTSGAVSYKTDQGNGCQYKDMTLHSSVSAAPEIAKALLLYPDEPGGDYGGDYHWVNTTGERLPLCGGQLVQRFYVPGVFSVILNYPRSSPAAMLAFAPLSVNCKTESLFALR